MERVITGKPPYRVDEAAELLGLNIQTVRIWVREGRLPAFRVGKRWLIPRERLDRMLAGEAAA